MNGPGSGKSLYYATDKNIFDALNEHKVDSQTVAKLFRQRNTIVSSKTERAPLAEYFSRLNHDYYDHIEIAAKLGVVPRRERITSRDVLGIADADAIVAAVDEIAETLHEFGDIVSTSRDGSRVTVSIQYKRIDYRKSEFNQIQVRDGTIEFHPTPSGYTVRNTHNEYMDALRESLLSKISSSPEDPVTSHPVSLQGFPDPKTRSGFFYDLFSGLKVFSFRDLTDIYVYKPDNEGLDADEHDLPDSHVERVILRGTGVSRSEFLTELAEDGYYTTKVGWRAADSLGRGDEYAIEAVFSDPVNCTGFSFILLGVHQYEDGLVMKNRRSPNKHEVAAVSDAIESRARELMAVLRSQGIPSQEAEGDSP